MKKDKCPSGRSVGTREPFGGKRREFLKLACALPIVLPVSSAFAGEESQIGFETFALWQLPSQTGIQMMSYVLQSESGRVVVIDGGWTEDGSYLKGFLAALGNHVDAWFITHPHADHLEALTWIISNPGGMVIDNIYASFPPMEWLREHAPGTAGTLAGFSAALAAAGKSYTEVEPGDVFDFDETHVEIISTKNTEITVNSVNNSSMTFRVSGKDKTVLFTGDIGAEAAEKILKNVDHQKLKADYLQMAHHGQGGAVRSFYEVVNSEYCLWPTPLWLWNNDKGKKGYNTGPWTTLETRRWMKELHVKKSYVSGISGLVKID